MKVELHLHTSRYSACATATPFELMRALIDAGYDAAYITEHDAVWRDWEIEHLQAEFPQIRIFGGVELTVSDGPLQHLLVLGTSDPEYLAIRDPQHVLEKAHREGHLVVLAHPFRWDGADRLLELGLLPDAIEYYTCNHDVRAAEKSLRAADRLDLRLLNAGDVHGVEAVGRFWIETDQPVERADDIRRIVLTGHYRNADHGDW